MTAPTPFLGLGLAPAFLVLLPLAAVWMQHSFGGGWGRGALAGLLATATGFLAVAAAYTLVLRRFEPRALWSPPHGEWVVTRADAPFAVLAWALFAVTAWMAALAAYPAHARVRVRWRMAALGAVDVLVVLLFFALTIL